MPFFVLLTTALSPTIQCSGDSKIVRLAWDVVSEEVRLTFVEFDSKRDALDSINCGRPSLACPSPSKQQWRSAANHRQQASS